MKYSRTIHRESVLVDARLTVVIEDDRENFSEPMFGQLLGLCIIELDGKLLDPLDRRGDFVRMDTVSLSGTARDASNDHTRVKVEVHVTYSRPGAERYVDRHVERLLNRLVNTIPAMLEDKLGPKPDLIGFIRSFAEAHETEGHPTPERLRELAGKFNIKVIEFPGGVAVDIQVGPEEFDKLREELRAEFGDSIVAELGLQTFLSGTFHF